MKTHAQTIVKIFSLSIMLLCLVYGVYAQNEYAHLFATGETLSKYKTQSKKTKTKTSKLAILTSTEIAEEQKQVENWMLNINLIKKEQSKYRETEEWMFDEYFWKIKKPITDEDVIEKPREIESWMIYFEPVKTKRTSFFNHSKKSRWSSKDAFLIL